MRNKLVKLSLEWQKRFGVCPAITSTVSEYDAAILIGMSEEEYSTFMQNRTAVSKGYDFIYNDLRYQIKANRPSGKKGSKITKVPKATNYDWDFLIWIEYDKFYEILQVWQWSVRDYKREFENKKRLSPKDYMKGENIK